MYTYGEMRHIAAGAVRSYLRELGITPETASVAEAEAALDELAWREESLVAYVWWVQCSSQRQTRLFRREWRKWCNQQMSMSISSQR
ncbi:MAG: hypothetical protein V1755_13750 [Chloroflexota bacterium]